MPDNPDLEKALGVLLRAESQVESFSSRVLQRYYDATRQGYSILDAVADVLRGEG